MASDDEQVREALLSERVAASARRDELLGDLHAVVEGSRDVATDDEHDPEGATIAYERAKTAALIRQAEGRLAELQHALARLDAGTYATCECCGDGITRERLEAKPSATTCVSCAARGSAVSAPRPAGNAGRRSADAGTGSRSS
jgi:RNA polymerase-binding transcription factor DksA